MTAKELNKAIDTFFTNHKSKDCATYESLIELFEKQPTAAQAKNIFKLATKHKTCLYTSSEHAKKLNDKEAEARRAAQRKLLENNETDNFDILKEHELLEWSRSDSPVRMYLREMGQIPLLTKEEEIEISKKIEGGESIIIDAICSVPYLIDFILDYKEPLINRERRVKELFKSFEDEKEDSDDGANEDNNKSITEDKTRVEKVTLALKHLKKLKKIG
jgi:RNA polymerase primary sigma factor